jgi:hypothetical protein
MNKLPLMRVAIESAVFLGVSGDDVVQPDAAVSQLEGIASTLQELDGTGREEFLTFIREIAMAEERLTGRTPRVEFLLSLGENLRLV